MKTIVSDEKKISQTDSEYIFLKKSDYNRHDIDPSLYTVITDLYVVSGRQGVQHGAVLIPGVLGGRLAVGQTAPCCLRPLIQVFVIQGKQKVGLGCKHKHIVQ